MTSVYTHDFLGKEAYSVFADGFFTGRASHSSLKENFEERSFLILNVFILARLSDFHLGLQVG